MLLPLFLTQEEGTKAQIVAMSWTSESRQCLTGSMPQSWELTGLFEDLEFVWYSSLGKSPNLLKSVSSSVRRFYQEEVYDIADGASDHAGVSYSCVIFTVGRNNLVHQFWASFVTDPIVHAIAHAIAGQQDTKHGSRDMCVSHAQSYMECSETWVQGTMGTSESFQWRIRMSSQRTW